MVADYGIAIDCLVSRSGLHAMGFGSDIIECDIGNDLVAGEHPGHSLTRRLSAGAHVGGGRTTLTPRDITGHAHRISRAVDVDVDVDGIQRLRGLLERSGRNIRHHWPGAWLGKVRQCHQPPTGKSIFLIDPSGVDVFPT